jgi:hypothetical protein
MRGHREKKQPQELPFRRGKGFARSIRFDRTQAQFLKEEEANLDKTVAEIVRGALDDQRTFFGTPRPQLEKHLADMTELNMNRREYMQYLLSLRYEAIIQGAVNLSQGGSEPSRTRGGRR